MKKIVFALIIFVLFSSHVMYLKLDSYFLEPNSSAIIQLFNGTFEKSENIIDRDRMLDASMLGNGQRLNINATQWTEKDNVTLLNFQTGDAGTWVAGISTGARAIEMDAKAFNTYLEHEGILDMIAYRRENHEMDEAAVEKYSKHVKTIFQVGDKRTKDWKKPLGYPIEFVPLENPYKLNTGDSIRVRLLFEGKPLANQLVYANFKAPDNAHTHSDPEEKGHGHDINTKEEGHSHKGEAAEHSHKDKATHSHDDSAENSHSHSENSETHTHTAGQKMRTDAEGVVTAALTSDGVWYLQTIHLVKTEEEGFTHESNWTTLTFQVTHAHDENTHTHMHEDEDGIPSWVYWAGSILLVGLLFFWFNRKK
jgi:uncharacterized GH25 family protein